jgi:hypothetical protein
VILEGNADPANAWAGEAGRLDKGMADRFPDAAAVVASQDARLGLGATADEVTDTYLALAERLDRAPASLPGASSR